MSDTITLYMKGKKTIDLSKERQEYFIESDLAYVKMIQNLKEPAHVYLIKDLIE